MDTPFRYFLQVRYGECDAQKVVFNARYGDYIDLAATEFLHHICDRKSLPAGDFDYQVVKTTIEFRDAARYRDRLAISVEASHIGNTSFTLTMQIHHVDDQRLLTTAELIGVSVDPRTVEKMTIPDAMRQALARGGHGLYVDHAGVMA